MSKERKRRREIREAENRRVLERNARIDARRAGRKALWRRLTLHEWRQRSNGTLTTRSRAQWAIIVTLALLLLFLIWKLVASVALSIALTLLLVLAMPVLVIVAFDRRS